MKRYYDDDEENGQDAYGVKPQVLPDGYGLGDLVLAGLVAVATIALVFVFSPQALYPTAWGELAVSAGLRPTDALFPGLSRLVSRAIYVLGGAHAANAAMPVIGKVLLGICAFLAYYVFRGALAVIVRLRVRFARWSSVLARLIAVLGAFLLVCSDPMWTAAQTFSSPIFLTTLTLVIAFMMVRFLMAGNLVPVFIAMFLLGLLSAETPFGLILMFAFWIVYAVIIRNGHLSYMRLLQPFVRQISKWFITFTWVFGFLLGVAANVLGYIGMEGLAANGLSLGDLPIAYISGLWRALVGAASAGGWIVGAGVIVMPCVLSLILVSRATDEDVFLPYHVGVIFILCGLFAYSQTASLAPLWFWRWIRHPEMISDRYVLACLLFLNVLTVVCALAVFAVDGYCRNHRRLVLMQMPDGTMDAPNPRFEKFVIHLRRLALVLVPALLIGGVLPGRVQSGMGALLSVVNDYVREVVTEADGVKFLFTDGSCDTAFELEAAARGQSLRAFSMISGNSPRETWMRVESMADGEDRLSAQVGAPNLLRTWQRDKPARLDEAAMQLGFELWKRSGKTPPLASGVLARTAGLSETARAEGVSRALALATRILDLYAAGGIGSEIEPHLTDIFLFVQWRLARITRVRAEGLDLAGKTDQAMREMKLADALDDRNDSLKRILRGMARMRELTMRQMTPREGLQFALVRADFALARRYAEPILDADPDDPNANFGMGMSYFVQEQFGRAEEYLRRCLKRNAKEPAVWNNIAVLQLRQNRFAEARANAKKALALVPDSAEVKDTLRQIDKLEKAAATNKVGKAASPAKAGAK